MHLTTCQRHRLLWEWAPRLNSSLFLSQVFNGEDCWWGWETTRGKNEVVGLWAASHVSFVQRTKKEKSRRLLWGMKREGWKEKKRNVWTKEGVWAQKDVFEFLRVRLCLLSCIRGRNCCAWLAACSYLWVSVRERLKRVAGGVCYQRSAVAVWGGQGWDKGRNWKGRTSGVCPGWAAPDPGILHFSTHTHFLLLTSGTLTHTDTQLSLNELTSLTKRRWWSLLTVMSGYMMLQTILLVLNEVLWTYKREALQNYH